MIDSKTKIRSFIVKNFLFGSIGDLKDDTSFLGESIIDSTGFLELIAFLEEQFTIKISDSELTTENFDSINKIADYLSRKRNKIVVAA